AGILIRSCEPVSGHALIKARRGGLEGPIALTGPGKVAAALAVDGSCSGQALFRKRGLRLLDAPPPAAILVGPRVGIGYASEEHQRAPWRFAIADSPWVSSRKGLSLQASTRSTRS
ncbi:MAG TPA: DNA-3-methyladenine glycosylase, partial [Polyangiales bacterium]|nr:DNA-3-methyladenine glycosylase [Polyangiales bacterium]